MDDDIRAIEGALQPVAGREIDRVLGAPSRQGAHRVPTAAQLRNHQRAQDTRATGDSDRAHEQGTMQQPRV